MKAHHFRFAALTTAALLFAVPAAWSADIERIPFSQAEATQPGTPAQASAMVMVDNLVYPSGIYGTKADPLDQVDEVIEKMDARLKAQGLSFANMLQHTWFVKEGAVDPIAVLKRFGEVIQRVAPTLATTRRSVGTIIRVPEMPGGSVVMLDMVAGKPLPRTPGTSSDGYKRVPFVHGPQGIVETISGNRIMFTAGMEGLDFKNMKLAPSLDDQITAVVDKIEHAFKAQGLSLAQMVQHDIYYRIGANADTIVNKFHAELEKREPLHKKYPGVGAMYGVDGMAMPGFWLEVDVVGTTLPPDQIKGVPYVNIPMDVHRTATVGDLTYVVDVSGQKYAGDMPYPDSLDAQIDLAVKNLRDFLHAGGLKLTDLVKVRLAVLKGAGSAQHIEARFHQAIAKYAASYAAHPAAETLIYVEKLDRTQQIMLVPIAAK